MCYRPLLIPNKSFRPDDPLSRQYNLVGCNRCPSCIALRKQEVAFRAMQEYQQVLNRAKSTHDGFACFLTTTYKGKYRPSIVYKYKDGVYTKSTWNMKHIDSYFKSLNSWFSKYYPGSSIKHLMTCERGSSGQVYTDDRGRQRVTQGVPHYHFIFFVVGVPDCDKEKVMSQMCYRWGKWIPPISKKLKPRRHRNEFGDMVSDHAGYFDSYGRVDNLEVDRSADRCILYVTKYAYKNLNESLHWIKVTDIIKMKNLKSSLFMYPRTLQSNGIGRYFLYQFHNDWHKFLEYLFNHLEGASKIILPRYYFKFTQVRQNEPSNPLRDDVPVFTCVHRYFSSVFAQNGQTVATPNGLVPHKHPIRFGLAELPSFKYGVSGLSFDADPPTLYRSLARPGTSFFVTTPTGIKYFDVVSHVSGYSYSTSLGLDYKSASFDVQVKKHVRDVRAFVASSDAELSSDYIRSQPFGDRFSKDDLAHFDKLKAALPACRMFIDSLDNDQLSDYVRSYLHSVKECSFKPFGYLFTAIMRANAFFRVYRSGAGFYQHEQRQLQKQTDVLAHHPVYWLQHAPDDAHRIHVLKK